MITVAALAHDHANSADGLAVAEDDIPQSHCHGIDIDGERMNSVIWS